MTIRRQLKVGDKIVFSRIHRSSTDNEPLIPAMGIGQITRICPDQANAYLVGANGWVRKKDITEVIPLRKIGDKISYNAYCKTNQALKKVTLADEMKGKITYISPFSLNQYLIDGKYWIRESFITSVPRQESGTS